jgi:hypothetical protein
MAPIAVAPDKPVEAAKPIPAPVAEAAKPAASLPAQVDTRTGVERPEPTVKRPVRKNWFSMMSAGQQRDASEICKIRKGDPCAGMMPKPRMADGSPPPRERISELFGKFDDEQREKVELLCRRVNRNVCDTPLVVAFEGQPIELVPAAAEVFAFRPGEPASSDWPSARTPWLAIDRDGDGAITSGAELFGDSTRLPTGATARNGFAALAPLDANGDGVIDRRDPMFATLLLWTDRDGDHASSAAELRPASDVVIAIPVAGRAEPRCDARGNCEGERAEITWRDASGAVRTGAIVDVYVRGR